MNRFQKGEHEKIYCIKCTEYRKFKNLKIYIFSKTLFLSIICDKCGSEDKKIFKEEESTQISQICSLIKNQGEYQINV